MTITRRTAASAILATAFAASGLALAQDKGKAKGKTKAHHNDGHKLLGDKLKTKAKGKSRHTLEKKGPHTVSFDLTDGKIAGMDVKHDKKGAVAVKKYKSKKKLAQAQDGFVRVSYVQVQDQYLGTTWIGYAYYDDWGDEQIYWFPYDVILDGDTGAIEYVAAY